MKIKNILMIILALIISYSLVYIQEKSENKVPQKAYRVYLEGCDIGLIKDRISLENYIDKQQEAIKNKYNVDKVFIPNNLDIVEDVTFDNNYDSIEVIYDKINQISPFTIKGYNIVVDKTNSSSYINDDNTDNKEKEKIINLYVLNKSTFTEAVKNVILSFVSSDEYNAFVENDQLRIEGTGELIEDLYIEDEITIKEAFINVSNKIYSNEEELTKYLIFGSHANEKTYTVKNGDTIPSIAENNKMSVNELLIANSSLKTENSLLYSGQELFIGTLEPIFTTIVEKHVVTDQVVKYKTTFKYDNTLTYNRVRIDQKGIDGLNRVTQKIRMINGEIEKAIISNTEELSPMVEEIVARGRKQERFGDGEWVWPTNRPYIISSSYGWRWGKLHEGVDICGTGNGSPIYAARSGTITRIEYRDTPGYFVEIDHGNGYFSHYLHMLNTAGNSKAGGTCSATKYVKIGQYVEAGAVIGDMGSSGFSTGTHLHFGIWYGKPWFASSKSYNPLIFY